MGVDEQMLMEGESIEDNTVVVHRTMTPSHVVWEAVVVVGEAAVLSLLFSWVVVAAVVPWMSLVFVEEATMSQLQQAS